MNQPGRTTVKQLPAGVRLENLSEWLSEARLAVVGLRRRHLDVIAPHALPGQRLLLLTLELGDDPQAARHGSAGIVMEAGGDGEERWARITAQANRIATPCEPGDARAIARSLGFALRRALRDAKASEYRDDV
jgi:hypothetical protein